MIEGHEEEFRRLFEGEASAQLERLADTVLELERNPAQLELAASLFRDAHALTGSAALRGLPGVAGVARELEDVLDELRSTPSALTPELTEAVLDVVAALRTLVDAGLSADERLRTLWSEEVGAGLARLSEGALALERRGAQPELVASLARGVRSLGRSAAIVGLDDISLLAGRLDARLAELATGARPASPAFVDALVAVLDAVVAATPLLAVGRDASLALDPARAALDALAPGAVPPPEERAGPEPAPGLAPGIVRPPPLRAARDAEPRPSEPADPEGRPAADARPAGGAEPSTPGVAGAVLAEARAAASRLTRLVAGAIDEHPEARVAAGRLEHALAELELLNHPSAGGRFEELAGGLELAAAEAARAAGHEVRLALEGTDVRLDRVTLDGLRGPLGQLVRNAAEHAAEPPEARGGAGKAPELAVQVTAEATGDELALTVADDGRGLDDAALRAAADPGGGPTELAELVFAPGLTTTGDASRGLGLDAVRAAIGALGGRVTLASAPGTGCLVTVTVPAARPAVACLALEAGGRTVLVPADAVHLVVEAGPGDEIRATGGRTLWAGGEAHALSELAELLGAPGARPASGGPAVVLVSAGGVRHAFRVDAVLGSWETAVGPPPAAGGGSGPVAGTGRGPAGTPAPLLAVDGLVDAARRLRGAPTGPR